MTKTLTSAIDVAASPLRPARLRAVAYLRVSTEEQAKGYGIAYTEKKVLRYFEKKGYEHVGTFADEGLSGSLEAHDRPDLKRLMELARQEPRPFDLVGVNEGRAIGRTGRAFWRWVWELEDLGIYVAVAKKDYDNSTSTGRSQMRKDADYAEEERELIRERTQGGIQEKAEDGLYPGGTVPFGWGVNERSEYVINEAEGLTLSRAREIFVTKKSWTAAALTLNSEQRYTRAGKPWTRKNLRSRMLSEAVLNNRIIWRGRGAMRDQDGNPVFGETVIINLPPIFSEEEIEELRAADAARPRTVKTRERVYLLRGLMSSPCGQLYQGHHNRPTEIIYQCKGNQESYPGSGDQCSCPRLEAESVERQVWSEVVKVLTDVERMKAMAQDWLDATAGQRVDHTDRLAELDQQIAELEDLIEVAEATAARRALRRGLSKAEAQEAAERAAKPHMDELDGLEKLKRETEAWQREAAEVSRRLEGLERVAKAARENLGEISDQERAELMDLMGLEAQVVRAAPRRMGVACGIREWFIAAERDVPLLTADGWELIKPLMGGSRSKIERRQVVEVLLEKAVTGDRMIDLGLKYGLNPKSLQTQSHRWLADGTWARAMGRLKDAKTRPVWQPDPIEIKVTIRPLAIESKVGTGARDRTDGGSNAYLALTFTTAA